MDCEACKEGRKHAQSVSFQAHQADMARMERSNKRLWVALIIMIVMLLMTNAGWIWYESRFTDEVITQEVTQDADNGENHFTGGDYYGEATRKNYG